METYIIRLYPSGQKVTKHPINKVLGREKIQLLDLRLPNSDSDDLFYLILKKTPDSSEHFEEILLQVSESGCSIPVGAIDLRKCELELIAVPSVPMEEERYCIEIEYKILS